MGWFYTEKGLHTAAQEKQQYVSMMLNYKLDIVHSSAMYNVQIVVHLK